MLSKSTLLLSFGNNTTGRIRNLTNKLVSGQIYAPGASCPAQWIPSHMPVWAVCGMLESLSLVEFEPSIVSIGSMAWQT